MEDLEQRVLQIRRAHGSAKPTDRNPAWLNCSRDMTVMFEYIDELRVERNKLQHIIDSRPAINQALPDSYVSWSRSIYAMEIAHALEVKQ